MQVTLTPEQAAAKDKFMRWLTGASGGDDWFFRLGGYAGTGKTTLLNNINEELQQGNLPKPTFMAPTGKAASVLRRKLGGREVITCHKALYNPVPPTSDELKKLNARLLSAQTEEMREQIRSLIAKERHDLEEKRLIGFSLKTHPTLKAGQLAIVDEASMVSEKMREDMRQTGAKFLFVGDPGQLPPVGDGGWFLKGQFNAMLESVQRQALDSPIIRLSMEVREGRPQRQDFQTPECRIVRTKEIDRDEWLSADKILTGRNEARRRLNRYCRKGLGRTEEYPMHGDKLICMKNETFEDGQKVINGVECVALNNMTYDESSGNKFLDVLYDGKRLEGLCVYDYHFRSHYVDGLEKLPWQMRRKMREFDFAYAITVHKSQGSEWDDVILADDRMQANDAAFRRRWLYTAITRAKTSFAWVENDPKERKGK